MNVFECIKSLSSIRSYVDKEIPDEILANIIEAGRLAPSAHNDQPWQFIIIRDRNILNKLKNYCKSGGFVSQVNLAVVVITDPSSKWHEIDSTRAVQNMVLTAWSYKIGSCWIGRLDKVGLHDLLNIPKSLNILTVLPFGYFNDNLVSKYKYRKDQKEIFHYENFGTRNRNQSSE